MPTSVSERTGLVLEEVTAGYGSVTVVRDVSLHVHPGEFVCVLGPNGAGKTTLLRSIMGDAHITKGSVSFSGRTTIGRQSHHAARMGLALVPEGRELAPDLSVRENLVVGSFAWNRSYSSPALREVLDEVVTQFPVLGRRHAQAAGSLSGGEQQMLAIGRAMMARPSMLLLDEPSLGLAPKLIAQVFDHLVAANLRDITVLVAEQNAAAVLRVATRCYVMAGGQIVAEGDPTSIWKSSMLREAFLAQRSEDQL